MKKLSLPGIFIISFLFLAGFLAVDGIIKTNSKVESMQTDTALNGHWAIAYETAFNKNLDIYEPSVATWGTLNYFLFEEGREGVLVGDNGWLFTKEEFEYFPHQEEEIGKKIQYIKHIKNIFQEKGIHMVVALIPAKARVYQDSLGRYRFPSYQEIVYDQSRRDLKRQGVTVANIYSAMESYKGEKDLFLKTDTHWTPQGAEIAALTIKQTIENKWPSLSLPVATYKTVLQDTVKHEGDLLSYIPLGPWSDDLGLKPDRIVTVETERLEGGSSYDTENSLFSDETYPVALVGTSYSANPQWNFEGFLRENLKTEVLNVAQEGRGPFETMKEYLEDESFQAHPPRLVIWEIPERYLSFTYDLAVN